MKNFFVLKESPFFNGMNNEEILSVIDCIDAKSHYKKAGEYIYRTGDITDAMGLVLSGAVLIMQEDLWGHRNIISKIEQGDFFGEPFAVMTNIPLNISAVASEDSEILFINISNLLNACPNPCQHHTKLIRNLVSVLANKVLVLNEKITHMSKRTTREKLMSYLSAESIKQGKLSFDIPYDRQQLADFLCVERAAMSAEISKLRKEGILQTHKNHFVLISINELYNENTPWAQL